MIKDLMPWQKIGRWYHVRLISDGKKVTVEASDLKGVTHANDHLVIPFPMSIIDYKIDFKRRKFKSEIEITHGLIYTINDERVSIPSANVFEKMDIFIFGKMEG